MTIAIAAYAVLLTVAMIVVPHWNPWLFLAAAIPLGAPAARRLYRRPPGRRSILSAVPVLLFAYAALTAQITSPDLLFFWGSKAQHFAIARQIDAGFLAAPEHRLMHPDYPPLVPCVWAAALMLFGRFSWFGALFTSVVALAGIAALAGNSAIVAIAAFGLAVTQSAGNADAVLLLFVTLALVAESDLAVAIALAGAVLTKVEGAFFVILYLLAFPKRIRAGIAPAIALGIWIAFAASHGLLQSYAGRGYGPFSLAHLGLVVATVVRAASYHSFYAPWIAAIALIVASRARLRDVAPHLFIAGAFVLVIIATYLHDVSNVRAWISSSANRVLLTPLLVLALAATRSSTSRMIEGEWNTRSKSST